MNARNCQLCGKPLSRLRVGGDGDFCSKEHRNQFRLRAGMDRLVEVNKVASLMRRRESPRQIPLASLMRRGQTARHDFGNLIPTTIAAQPRIIELRTDAASRPHLAASGDNYLRHQAAPARGGNLEPRVHPGAVPIAISGGAEPRMVARRQAGKVAFPRRDINGLELQPSQAPAAPRDFVKLPASAPRTHLGPGPAMLRRSRGTWAGTAPQACAVAARAAEGKPLRVSIGVRFHVPEVRQPRRSAMPRMASALLPVERAQELNEVRRDCPVAARTLAIAMPEIATRLPGGPARAAAGGLAACRALTSNARIPRDMESPAPRAGQVLWTSAEPALRSGRISQSGAGFARRAGAPPFVLELKPNRSQAAPQLGAAPFSVSEELCIPSVPYCNVLAAASAAEPSAPDPVEPVASLAEEEPGPTPVAEMVRYEEHFDDGWDNWVGGVADWKVDVAGVRIGSLALYMPSLDLNDYDLEFLTRIDSRSVNWVVRATGSDAHLRCTVAAVEGGQLEFTRAVVTGGAAEGPMVSQARVPGKPRATFTVRMNVAGPVFSLSIDGKTIDSWVDDRLATGGIGFMGAPDDRARLYWVRVSSPAAPGKEQAQ